MDDTLDSKKAIWLATLCAVALTLVSCITPSKLELADSIPSIKRTGETVHYEGIMEEDAVSKVIEMQGVTKLVINSSGGDTRLGMRLGHWVYDRKIDVEVSYVCASSCANYIFTAGRKKTIAAGALIIWHGNVRSSLASTQFKDAPTVAKKLDISLENAQVIVESFRQEKARMMDAEREFFEKIGVDPRICEQTALAADAGYRFYTLTIKDMQRFGLDNLVSTNYESTPLSRFGKPVGFVHPTP